jgi:hypothetical protein
MHEYKAPQQFRQPAEQLRVRSCGLGLEELQVGGVFIKEYEESGLLKAEL